MKLIGHRRMAGSFDFKNHAKLSNTFTAQPFYNGQDSTTIEATRNMTGTQATSTISHANVSKAAALRISLSSGGSVINFDKTASRQ